jgi:hypothetical protein
VVSRLEVMVERYALWVDAAQTVRAVLDGTDTGAGDRLAQALSVAAAVDSVRIAGVPAGHGGDGAVFLPGGELLCLSVSTVEDALAGLAAGGLLRVRPVWAEESSAAYLSQGRRLSLVQVRRPFVVFDAGDHADDAAAGGRGVDGGSGVVAAGWYLLGEVGDVVPDLVGAGRLDLDEAGAGGVDAGVLVEGLVDRLVETDGFGASLCVAGCGACGARWLAESGSWHFIPAAGSGVVVAGWDFDDAEGFGGDGTIGCPACAAGRVGFSVT